MPCRCNLSLLQGSWLCDMDTDMPLHCMQRVYSPAAINVDFALITLKTPVTEGTGYYGIQRGTGEANIDLSSVRALCTMSRL